MVVNFKMAHVFLVAIQRKCCSFSRSYRTALGGVTRVFHVMEVLEMKVDAFVQQFRNGWDDLARRRKEWDDHAQPLIAAYFESVIGTMRDAGIHDVYVNSNASEWRNFGSVQFWFGSAPSGIAREFRGGGEHKVEEGAAMGIGMSNNGRLVAWRHPFAFDGISDGPEVCAVFPGRPGSVTEAWVANIFEEFLEWVLPTSSGAPFQETGEVDERTRIGFQVPPRPKPDDTGSKSLSGD